MPRIIIGLFIASLGLSAIIGVSLFKFLIAILLVVIGIRIVLGRSMNDVVWTSMSNCSDDYMNEVAIISPLNLTFTSAKFSGGKLVMVFAGGTIDLSNVKFSSNVVDIEIVCVFGGCKLIVPKDCKVNIQGTAIVGGYDNKVAGAGTGSGSGAGHFSSELNLRGAMIFGGVEILN